MLKNVDEIIGRPFPNNGVFNWRLTNFEVGFILQPFFLDYNRIARLKVRLKVVLNLIEYGGPGPQASGLHAALPSIWKSDTLISRDNPTCDLSRDIPV